MARVVVVQPYVPVYRVAFFTQLIDELARRDVELVVAAGRPQGEQALRGDEAAAPWATPYRERRLAVGSRFISLGGAAGTWRDADAVVLGLVGSSLDVHRAVAARAIKRHLRVGVWGHVKAYVAEPNPIDAWVERAVMRRVDHVFAYTPGGSAHALAAGVARERITTVMNTVDTSTLVRARAAVTTPMVDAFRAQQGLDSDRTLAYIGGLDRSKRIGFLASALAELWRLDPQVRLLVGGQGADASLLGPAQERGQVVMLGRVDAPAMALMARVSQAIVSPGRVGLVALDALVLGRPVLAARYPYHAPEFEYLREPDTLVLSDDDPAAFAAQMAALAQSASEPMSVPFPTIEDMVWRFADGVTQLLA